SSFDQGEVIASQLQRSSLSKDGEERFYLNFHEKKGVFARCKVRAHFDVPLTVRALTNDRLKEMDEKWRKESHFTHAEMQTESEPFNQWACLISDNDMDAPPGYCRMVVEGFPSRKVADCCEELMNIINGEVLSCEGEGEWLLTGIGRNMAEQNAKIAMEKYSVFVDFNVIGKEIRLFGRKEETEKVKRRLLKLAKNRLTHIVNTRVTIGLPVYMNRTCRAIEACGGLPMMQRVVGECTIKPCLKDADKRTLVFEGTVAAHERLMDFLGDLDDTLRESAKKEYEKMRRANPSLKDASFSPLTSSLFCPICFCRPSSDFYRLESCGHVYCSACIVRQLSSDISSHSFPLVCQLDQCGKALAVSDVIHLLTGSEKELRMDHLDGAKLRPLIESIVEHARQTKRDRIVPCRIADCNGIFARSRRSRIEKCHSCKKDSCVSCGFEPHEGHSCEEYENIREKADASMEEYMRNSNSRVKKCPNGNCSAMIEKSEGCNHMECPMCKTHFCWLCGFSSMAQGDIYKHMNEQHGGNGL
ncbi:hypothetical protein PFISCL1PPCAC_1254, partial [Pristionchus fissidentatus]